MNQNILESVDYALKSRIESGQFRRLLIHEKNDKEILDFASNDYLGLSQHPLLKSRAIQYLERYGSGSGAARLVTGTLDCYPDLEKKIAILKNQESALILNSGYQANVSLLSSLIKKDTVILADKLCHNSLLMGAKLGGGRLIRYRHNDYQHLDQLLSKLDIGRPVIIVTESVFGMDGDCADLARLVELKKQYNAFLYVDEAHATGVFGKQGGGLSPETKGIDVVMGTFGKALGSFGAYVACSQKLKDYFINCCGGFIYSTALPPPVLGSIDAALDLLPSFDIVRNQLQDRAALLRGQLRKIDFDCGLSETHIIPLIVGQEEKALALSRYLQDHKILAIAIRPPTVALSHSRVRLALSAYHSEEDLKVLIDILKKYNPDVHTI
ncbi:MAG: 8-amino-7-oxononanoate synthase [Chlamydiales bacterium]|jgi:8-amino-7-oxononanoate synthase